MRFPFAFRSLRFKLVFASVIVEVILLSVLVANSERLIEKHLIELANQRLAEVKSLLNNTLIAPLVARDYGTLQETLNQTRSDNGIAYLVLYDEAHRMVASSGWEREDDSRPLDNSIVAAKANREAVFDTKIPLTLSGIDYGFLRFGISMQFLHDATSSLRRESLLIAGVEILLSIAVLSFLGYWLTRHLAHLTAASRALAEGDIDITLPVTRDDEVGLLTQSFNAMAQAIKQRISELNANEERLHAIADYTYSWESWFDSRGKLIWVNRSVERNTGYSVEECMTLSDYPYTLVVAEDLSRVRNLYTIHFPGSTGHIEFRVRRKDGSVFWASAGWQSIYDKNNNYLGIRSSIYDVTDRKQVEFSLKDNVNELKIAHVGQIRLLSLSFQEQARMRSLLNAMTLGILFETADRQIAYHNAAFKHIWMIDDHIDLAGKPTSETLTHSSKILTHPERFSTYMLSLERINEVSDSFEIAMTDGRIVTQKYYPVRDTDDCVIGRLWVYEDITQERQTAIQLLYLAERDSLTGLWNRRRFQDELKRALKDVERYQNQCAVLFFDLDEFKYINDTYGHRAGDAMLIRVAGEVGALVRRNEHFSRLGGDEFALLIPNAHRPDVEALAERVIRAIAHIPFRFEERNFRLTVSIGIAFFPEHANDAEELVAHADAAMYQAKAAGKNAWRIYHPARDTSRKMVDRLSWNERINHAMEHALLRLHFQSIYDVNTGRLSHVEALVRMVDEQHPTRMIMPNQFIHIAEKSGKIFDIDCWVIREAISVLQKNPQLAQIAVNISGRSVDEPSLPRFIAQELSNSNVEPSRLLFELTETAAVSDVQDAQRFIESLQQTGCLVCLDDFGTGFSSFTYLKHLKVDILKIDGQFIRNLPSDPENQIFVRAILDVAHSLKKKTIAEFVEDGETMEMVKALGVDMVQGYYFGLPSAELPLDDSHANFALLS